MSIPILLAFHGYKGSGKNTAAEVVHEWGRARGLIVRDRGFADILKYSSIRALGIGVQSISDGVVIADSLKHTGDISIAIPEQSMLVNITGRQYLQNYGTEAHRDIFGSNFWVDQILPLEPDWRFKWADNEDDFPDIAVITDMRFENEAERVFQLGGDIWLIDRPGLETDGHSSERLLPKRFVNLTIRNDRGIDEFRTEVNSWLTANFQPHFVDKPDPLIDNMCADD